MSLPHDEEEKLLRSVAIQNAQSILMARQRAEEDLIAAKESLELRTAELERANELVRTIAENAASSLLMLDAQGIPTYMNPAAEEETLYTLAEFANRPFHEVLHAAPGSGGHPVTECPIKNAREQMSPLKNFQDVFVRRDGSAFPVSCSLSPLQREGRAAGAVLEFRDITEELLARRTLEDANSRKDEFLATLSHELRTPMTAVLGWTRMLKLGLSPSEGREALNAIEKSAEIQAQLIDDVLDVSRITAGRMTFKPSPVDVAPVLRAAMTTVHPAAAAKGIEILASVPPIIPRVLGDEGRLQQIMWNLFSNAVKFTPRGGTITVRLAQEGSFLRLTVQDTGKGIEPDYLPRVFEPFSQEDGGTTRSHEGIGLGLSIVRSLVGLHGGRVRVASEGRDRGTTFVVDLPVLESAPSISARPADLPQDPVSAGSQPDHAPQMPQLDLMRVLVIDDQAFTRDLVTTIFRRANAEVRSATSVREGLEQFRLSPPEVVVCDIAMPEEDGYVFVRAIRALPGREKSTPIIALTAFGRPEDRQHALAAGFDAYLKKPVKPQELVGVAAQLAARKSAAG